MIFEIGFRPQNSPTPDSQFVRDVLEQTGMICQDFRNAIQAYIKYKAYYFKESQCLNAQLGR